MGREQAGGLPRGKSGTPHASLYALSHHTVDCHQGRQTPRGPVSPQPLPTPVAPLAGASDGHHPSPRSQAPCSQSPPAHTVASLAPVLAAWAEAARACQSSGKERRNKSQLVSLRGPGREWVFPFLACPGDPAAGGAPLDACSRRELHLPWWVPELRWVELSVRASPEGQQDGRRRAGASSALWTGGAGKKEALVSQAGCIPALCAHLSGQELGCRRSRQARPPERAAAPAAPAPSPELPRGGWRRSRPSLQFGPGLPSSLAVQAPGSGAPAALGRWAAS